MKVCTQLHTTHLFPIPVPVSVPASVNRPSQTNQNYLTYILTLECIFIFPNIHSVVPVPQGLTEKTGQNFIEAIVVCCILEFNTKLSVRCLANCEAHAC